MKSWTVEEMLLCTPCEDYDRDKLVELWGGHERLSVLDILELGIPAKDRVWAALQGGDHVPAAVETIITRYVSNYCIDCGIERVEKWAKNWLDGTDRSVRSASAASTAGAETMAARATMAATMAMAMAEEREATMAMAMAEAITCSDDEYRQLIEDIRKAVQSGCF